MKRFLSLFLLVILRVWGSPAHPDQIWNYIDSSGTAIPFRFGIDANRAYNLTFPSTVTGPQQAEVLALSQFNNFGYSGVQPIVATGPLFPSGSLGGVTQLLAGTAITLSPAGGTGVVTINSTAVTSPGGTNGQIQYNNSGAFGGLTVGSGLSSGGGTLSAAVTSVNGLTGAVVTTTAVMIVHADGTQTKYTPAANTNVARGTALLNAVAAAMAGDTIYLSANTFDVGTSQILLPDSVNLRGAGMFSTLILSTNDAGSSGGLVVPGNNTDTSDLHIHGTVSDGSTYQWGWGFNNDTNTSLPIPLNCTAHRIWCEDDSDGCFFQDATETVPYQVKCYDCLFTGKWDSVAAQDGPTSSEVDLFNCIAISTGPSSFVGQGSHGVQLTNNGIFRMIGGIAASSGGNLENIGVLFGSTAFSQITFFTGVQIYSSGTSASDIRGTSSSWITLVGCYYNTINITSGAVLQDGNGGMIIAKGVNLNSTGDKNTAGVPVGAVVDKVKILNWSATPSATLSCTVRDASGGGGNSLLGTITGLNTPITSTALAAVIVPAATATYAQRVTTTNAVYFHVGTANGSALTADVVIYWSLPQ